MEKRDSQVGSTADGLVVIRSGKNAHKLEIKDPFAHWFVTDAGHRLVETAMATDPVYEAFNLARFQYTTTWLETYATQYKQVIFMGAGFDCRALGLHQFKTGQVKTFEVDTPEKLDQKLRTLTANNCPLPDWDCYVPADLRTDDVFQQLVDAGFDPTKPVLILAEGLTYFVPAITVKRLIDPQTLHLAAGSCLLFDCWTDSRVEKLNRLVKQRLGVELFHSFPFSVQPKTLEKSLQGMGYREITMTPLADIASKSWGHPIEDDFGLSWYVAEVLL